MLLQNHWNYESDTLNIKFLTAAANHLQNNALTEYQLASFQDELLTYQNCYDQANQIVQNAFNVDNGTFKLVVNEAIARLEDAAVEFKSSLTTP